MAREAIGEVISDMGNLIQTLGNQSRAVDEAVSHFNTMADAQRTQALITRDLAQAYTDMGNAAKGTELMQRAAEMDVLAGVEANMAVEAENSATGMAKLGGAVAAAAGPIAAVGAVGLGVAAVVTAIGGAAVKTAADYQTSMTQVQNNTGMTDAEMKVMDQTIQKLGADSGTPLKNLADAYRQVHDYGFDAADATKILSAANEAAVATGGNLSDVARVTAERLKMWGLDGTAAVAVTNEMTKASQDANATLQQYAESQKNAAVIAAAMGQPMTELDAVTVALTKHGFDLSQAQTQLANDFKTALDPTKKQHAEIVALGQSIGVDLVGDMQKATNGQMLWSEVMKEVKDSTHGNSQALAQLSTGLRGLPGLLSLLNGGWDDYNKELTTLSDTYNGKLTPVQDGYARSLQTLGVEWNRAKVSIQEVGIALGNALLPMVKQLLDAILPNIQALAQWMQANASTVVTIMEVVAAVGAAIAAWAGLALIILAAMTVFAALTGPVAIVITVLVALGVATVALIANFGAVQQAVQNFVTAVGSQFQNLGTGINNVITGIGQGLSQLSEMFGNALQAVLSTINNFVAPIAQALSWLDPTVAHSPSLLDNAQRGVAGILAAYSQFGEIPGLLSGTETAVSNFTATLTKFYDETNKVAEAKAAKAISEIGGSAADYYAAQAAVQQLQAAEAKLSEELDRQTGTLRDLQTTLDAAKEKYKSLQEAVTDAQTAMQDAKTGMQDLLNTTIVGEDAARAAANALHQQVADAQSAIDAMKASQDAQVASLQNMYDATQAAYQAAQDNVNNLNTAMQTTKASIDDAKTALNDLLQMSLPGTNDYNAASFAVNEQIKQAQLTLVQAQLGGQTGAALQPLQQNVQLLELQKQKLDLQRQLQTDPMNNQLTLLAKPITEMPFDQLVAGIKAAQSTITTLTPVLQTQTQAWTDAKVQQDAAKAAFDSISHAMDQLKKSNQEALAPLQQHLTALQGQAAAADAAVRGFDDMHKKLQELAKDQLPPMDFATLEQKIKDQHTLVDTTTKAWKDAKAAADAYKVNNLDPAQEAVTKQTRAVQTLKEAYSELHAFIMDSQKQIKDAATAAEQAVAAAKKAAGGGGGPVVGGPPTTIPKGPATSGYEPTDLQGLLGPGKSPFSGLEESITRIKKSVTDFKDWVGQHWTEIIAGLIFPFSTIPIIAVEITKHFNEIKTFATQTFGPGGPIGQGFSHLGTLGNQVFGPGGEIGKGFSAIGTAAHATFAPGGSIGQAFSQLGSHASDIFAPGGTIGRAFSGLGSFGQQTFEPGGTIGSAFSRLGAFGQQTFAPEGTVGQAYFRLSSFVYSLFVEGGIVGQAFSHLGSFARQTFEPGGTVGQAFSQLGAFGNQMFRPGGTIGSAFSAFGDTVRTTFAPGGTIGTAFSSFGTVMQTSFAPGGTIGTAFSSFGAVMQTAFAPGGTIGKAFSDFGNVMHDSFAPGGTIGKAFADFGKVVSESFGPGGTIGKAFSDFGNVVNIAFKPGGIIGKAFDDFGTVVHDTFAPAGTIGKAFDDFGKVMHDAFAVGGTIGKAFDDFGTVMHDAFAVDGTIGKAFDAFGNTMAAAFSPKGTIGAAFSAFGDFVAGIFSPGGAIGRALSALGSLIHPGAPSGGGGGGGTSTTGGVFDPSSPAGMQEVALHGDMAAAAWSAHGGQVMAAGGLVSQPTFALIGESGPEIVIPLSHLAKSTPSDGGNVTININNPQVWGTRDIDWLVQQISRAMVQRGLPAAGFRLQTM